MKRIEEKRLEFATKYGNWEYSDWENIIWTDESSFKLFRADGKLRVWRESKEKYLPECTAKTVKWGGGSAMIWGCFFADKLGPCYPITGTLNSEKYIQNILKPFYSNFFLENLGTHPKLIFQQDNAPCHTSVKTRHWFGSKRMITLQWPPQSPDLSPIENVWQIMKRQINMRPVAPRNIQELQEVLMEEWSKIPPEKLRNLLSSLPRRLKDVKMLKGFPTKY